MNVKNQKYGAIRIVRNFYSVELNKYTYHTLHANGVKNQRNNETYALQFSHGK